MRIRFRWLLGHTDVPCLENPPLVTVHRVLVRVVVRVVVRVMVREDITGSGSSGDIEQIRVSLSGLIWSSLVWSGLVSFCLLWSGLVWSGLVWSGLVWSGLIVFCLL